MSASIFIRVPPRISLRDGRTRELAKESVPSTLAPAAGPANNAMTQLNSGLHGKVGSIEKWLLIVIVVLGAVCLLCCVCCIIHVGTCGIL